MQNDLKELMKSIDGGLEKYFQESKEQLTTTKMPPELRATSSSASSSSENTTPIVVVNVVSEKSPAEEAGIQLRDQIISFGSITASNFKDLSQIGELVKNSQNRQLRIKVKRSGGQFQDLILVPKIWNGRGLLGCNIVPFSSTQM